MFGFGKKKQRAGRAVEDQLRDLGEIGIRLNPNASLDDLTDMYSREELEREPYVNLLVAMGSEIETGSNRGEPMSPQVHVQDTECIEDRGDYVSIARVIERLFDGELVLVDLIDNVDHETESAWIGFTCRGKRYESDLEFQDDWMDPKVLNLFIDAQNDMGTRRRLWYWDTGGQDFMLLGLAEHQAQQLKKLTKMLIVPLTKQV